MMSKHVWTRSGVARGGAALGLGLAVLTVLAVEAYGLDPVAHAGHAVRMVEFFDESQIGTQADPTENGSIIVECVTLRETFETNTARMSNSTLAVMPQYPLGPTRCWPKEHKRT
jgi:hypothetical protein